jgi:hypothetical protein
VASGATSGCSASNGRCQLHAIFCLQQPYGSRGASGRPHQPYSRRGYMCRSCCHYWLPQGGDKGA